MSINIKKVAAACICTALVFATTGCDIVSVNEDRDGQQVVATVGDAEIIKSEVLARYSVMAAQYGLNDSNTEYSELIKSFKKSTLDSMVEYEVVWQKAQEEGLEDKLTDEEKSSIESEYKETIDYIKSLYVAENVTKNNPATPVSTDAAVSTAEPTSTQDVALTATQQEDADKYIDKYLKDYGFTRDSYKKYLYTTKYFDMLQGQVKDEITDISDEDLKGIYDSELKTQQAAFDAAEQNSENTNVDDNSSVSYESYINDGKVVVYAPSGLGYYKHILIKFSDNIESQISDVKNNEALTADEVKTKVADLENQGYKEIQSKADEVLNKVKAGDDFDTLIKDYGEDTGMTSDTYKDTGYLVGKQSNYVASFKEACLGLKNVGDTTGLVKSEYGYHIIKKVSEVTSGVKPFEDVKDALEKQELETRKTEHWDKTLEQWKTDLNVKVNYDLLY